MDDVDEMQREILEAVDQKGPLYPGSPSKRALQAKYHGDAYYPVRLSVVTQELLKEGYLLPFPEGEREGEAEAVTDRGLKRLWELDHPRLHWFKANWFPVAVLAVGLMGIVAGIVADVLIKIFVDCQRLGA